jgi:hypothetical protein
MHEKCFVRTCLVLQSQSLKIRIISENNGLVQSLVFKEIFFCVNSIQLKIILKVHAIRIIFK